MSAVLSAGQAERRMRALLAMLWSRRLKIDVLFIAKSSHRAGNTSRSPERLAKAGVEFSKRLPKRSTTSKVEIVTSAGGGVPSSRPSSRH
jgi:hypothetical protein